MSYSTLTFLLSVAPEKEKNPPDLQAPHLPDGVQEIFTPQEETEASMSGHLTTLRAPPSSPAPVSKEEILQRAVDSISDLVATGPLMAPGSPQKIVDDFCSDQVAPGSPDLTTETTRPAEESSLSHPRPLLASGYASPPLCFSKSALNLFSHLSL